MLHDLVEHMPLDGMADMFCCQRYIHERLPIAHAPADASRHANRLAAEHAVLHDLPRRPRVHRGQGAAQDARRTLHQRRRFH
jgi:hypothetical protein